MKKCLRSLLIISALILFMFIIGMKGEPIIMSTEQWPLPKENWSFGDVGQQGHSFRILIHDPTEYNKARWINPRGENTTILLENLNDAAQYATGDHPGNHYIAPIKRIGKLETLMPILASDIVDSDYGTKVIETLGTEVAKIGTDKSLHFIASYELASMAVDPQSTNIIEQVMEAFILALGKGIEKEIQDKGLSMNDPQIIKLQNDLENIKNNCVDLGKQMQSLGLDEGDLLADLIGVFAGSSVKTLREFNYKYGAN